ncbi:MAG: ATP-binding cassette domain-containing protein [Eubacterium sp.]|jgi:putative ABC transport system permease protein
MIELKNVKKYFNRRKSNEIRAIDDTTLVFPDKGLVTLLGESGCGKTTLLNAIGGLDKVDSGEITVEGNRMTRRSSGARDSIRNRYIGYIFQNFNLIEDETVYNNVALVLRMIGFRDKRAIERRVMYILDRVGIARYRSRPVKMLSGGERQRVGIARALVKNPKVIIADEPTGNLDSANTIEVMNIIKAISREKLVILVTHERNIAEFYSDRIIEIVDGKVTADRVNSHEGSLDYRVDTRIYLQDMPYMKDLSADGFKVKLYSDDPDMPPEIKIVIKDGSLYTSTEGKLRHGSDDLKIIDAHYTGVAKDSAEQYRFDYDEYFANAEQIESEKAAERAKSQANKVRPIGEKTSESPRISRMDPVPSKIRYHMVYGPLRSLGAGFKKVNSYSKIKKVLLAGFVLASLFVMYAFSNVAGVMHVTDAQFVTDNKRFVQIKTGSVNAQLLDRIAAETGADFVLPGYGGALFNMALDDYDQSMNSIFQIVGSLEVKDRLSESDLLAGRLPSDPQEVVVDILIIDRSNDIRYSELKLSDPDDLIGRKLYVNYMQPFTIVGVSNTVQPNIYVDRSMLSVLEAYAVADNNPYIYMFGGYPVISSDQICQYSFMSQTGDLTIVKGEAPDEEYEALAPESLSEEYSVGSKLSMKVGDTPLVVSGFYHDRRGGEGLYVSDATYERVYYATHDTVTLATDDPQAALDWATENGYSAEYLYEKAKSDYNEQMRDSVNRTVLAAAIITVISLIEIYLIMRASFLSRIKEVGVLRAIGLKKGEIYRKFAGEAVAITIMTSLPAMAVMAYFLNAMAKSSLALLSDAFYMSPMLFLAAFGLVFIFNVVAGLLPLIGTLHKTPAAILARNDVN